MPKPFPPFVASLHVTVRIEPLSRAIDEDATFEKLIDGIRGAAFSAIGSTDWKSFRVNVDKVAPPDDAPKAWVDPAVVPWQSDRFAAILRAIQEEFIRQHRREGSKFKMTHLSDAPDHALTCNVLTVQGPLDIAALAQVICGATAF